MNITELEFALNLSLHDALLLGLSTDYVARTADFTLEVCVGDPDGKSTRERERRRAGLLQLTGLQYLAIDAPDANYPYREPSAVMVDACDADTALAARLPLPDPAFAGRLFVASWNGFIHFAATNANWTWLESVRRRIVDNNK